MRKVYLVLTGLLLVSVVIQFYFAAFGVFTAPENDSQFVLHQMTGRVVLPLLFLLVVAAAALARAPGPSGRSAKMALHTRNASSPRL